MLSLKKLALVTLLPLTAVGTMAVSIVLNAPCAHAGQCGECWNTGRKGVNVWRSGISDCDVCETNAFDPGDVRGPTKGTGGSGSRHTNSR